MIAVLPVIFPVHPRTSARLDTMAFRVPDGVHLCEPMPYREFLEPDHEGTPGP